MVSMQPCIPYSQSCILGERRPRPTVSPLTIPLVYCPINSFQRAASVEKPLPGGENRRDGRASHHKELQGHWVVSPPVCATGLSLIARGCLSGSAPRVQPGTSAM